MTGSLEVAAIRVAATTIQITKNGAISVMMDIIQTGTTTTPGIITRATGLCILTIIIETGYMNIIHSRFIPDTVLQVFARNTMAVFHPDRQEGGRSVKGYRVT
jgi:hypothetical protein